MPTIDRDPDDLSTARSRPLMRRCDDCAMEICEGTMCRACSETRRLLPRYLSLVRGRTHVRQLLAELDELDVAAGMALRR